MRTAAYRMARVLANRTTGDAQIKASVIRATAEDTTRPVDENTAE